MLFPCGIPHNLLVELKSCKLVYGLVILDYYVRYNNKANLPKLR